jgi:hypothetical protein
MSDDIYRSHLNRSMRRRTELLGGAAALVAAIPLAAVPLAAAQITVATWPGQAGGRRFPR